MTTQEILNMEYGDIMKLSRAELAKVTSQLQSTAKKRVARLEKSGLMSSATKQLRRGGALTTRNKNVNELRREFKRVKMFLENQLSSVRGIEKYTREINTRLGVKLTRDEQKLLFETISELQEYMPAELMRQVAGSDNVQRRVASLIKDGLTKDDIIESMQNYLNRAYESQVLRERDLDFYAEE